MRALRLQIFILSFCTLVSCQLLNSGDVDNVAQVNTGSQEYILTDSTFIDLTIKNLSNSPIYYNICDSRTIEEWQNEKVTQSIVFTNPCYCNCVITVQPGEEKELYINGYFINQHKENLKLTEEFRYKVFPHFYKDKEQSKRISLNAVNSTQFNLKTQ